MFKFVKPIRAIARRPRNFYSLLRASVVYYLGRREAQEKFRKTGHQFFCIYDPNDRSLCAITYKAYPGRVDSYQYLRRRGRIAPLTLQKFKEGAFYYTSSRNSAREMSKQEQQSKLDLLRVRLACDQTKHEERKKFV